MKNRVTGIVFTILFSSGLLAQTNSDKESFTPVSKEILINIMPNPVKNTRLVVKLEGLSNQQYILRVFNNNGAIAAVEKFISVTSTAFKMIELKAGFKGYGRMQLLSESGKVLAQSKFLSVD
ncbi:MAG TPA: hypothetical protein VFN30_13025 [Chitinophagaceae bacterium]|nr:hypothetical protein [Chitinophagaceae bacterium]